MTTINGPKNFSTTFNKIAEDGVVNSREAKALPRAILKDLVAADNGADMMRQISSNLAQFLAPYADPQNPLTDITFKNDTLDDLEALAAELGELAETMEMMGAGTFLVATSITMADNKVTVDESKDLAAISKKMVEGSSDPAAAAGQLRLFSDAFRQSVAEFAAMDGRPTTDVMSRSAQNVYSRMERFLGETVANHTPVSAAQAFDRGGMAAELIQSSLERDDADIRDLLTNQLSQYDGEGLGAQARHKMDQLARERGQAMTAFLEDLRGNPDISSSTVNTAQRLTFQVSTGEFLPPEGLAEFKADFLSVADEAELTRAADDLRGELGDLSAEEPSFANKRITAALTQGIEIIEAELAGRAPSQPSGGSGGASAVDGNLGATLAAAQADGAIVHNEVLSLFDDTLKDIAASANPRQALENSIGAVSTLLEAAEQGAPDVGYDAKMELVDLKDNLSEVQKSLSDGEQMLLQGALALAFRDDKFTAAEIATVDQLASTMIEQAPNKADMAEALRGVLSSFDASLRQAEMYGMFDRSDAFDSAADNAWGKLHLGLAGKMAEHMTDVDIDELRTIGDDSQFAEQALYILSSIGSGPMMGSASLADVPTMVDTTLGAYDPTGLSGDAKAKMEKAVEAQSQAMLSYLDGLKQHPDMDSRMLRAIGEMKQAVYQSTTGHYSLPEFAGELEAELKNIPTDALPREIENGERQVSELEANANSFARKNQAAALRELLDLMKAEFASRPGVAQN